MNTMDKYVRKPMRDNNSTPGGGVHRPDEPQSFPLSEQQVIQHLKFCRDATRTFAYRVFSQFWRQWCKHIVEYAEKARSNKDQAALFEVQNLLVAVQQAAEHEFGQHLANGFVKF